MTRSLSILSSSTTNFERLVDQLAVEMNTGWQGGSCPKAEIFFARHPELLAHKEAAVRLVFEEICIRQDLGDRPSAAELHQRFPQWQAEMELLLDGHSLLHTQAPSQFPAVGETFADLYLDVELYRSSTGCVFLATEPSLADRKVVVKMTACTGEEHLALARLQHTHVVPLYAVQHFPGRNLRVLCMPYLGGATFERLLPELEAKGISRCTGGDLLAAVDRIQAAEPPAWTERSPARKFLARASYTQAIAWVGLCLAEALQYAHERGFVHLDLKPANILLAADGQPMLLDFHLAHEPIEAGQPAPAWLGGTPGYMSPEQQAAMTAVLDSGSIEVAVDGRSDVYSLGLFLHEALTGIAPHENSTGAPDVRGVNPAASVGLADIIRKCLASEVRQRYASAGDLAADLRRHLNDLPLQGVRNRSWSERWRKWRRRRPQSLLAVGLRIGVVALIAVAATAAMMYSKHMADEARTELLEGELRLQNGNYAEAGRALSRGVKHAAGLFGDRALERTLHDRLRLAERGQAAQDLHRLADHIRFLFVEELLSPDRQRDLEQRCAAEWTRRHVLLDQSAGNLAGDGEQKVRDDLVDVALFWSDLRLGAAAAEERPRIEMETAATNAEADKLGDGSTEPTARRLYLRGRSLLHAGKIVEAAHELARVVQLHPQSFWPNFYRGVCAYRLKQYDDALNAFCICVALAPDQGSCFYNRALVQEQRGQRAAALDDLDKALQLDPDDAKANELLARLRNGR